MKTIFLGQEEVRGYLRDMLDRFTPMPSVWCPITRSGRSITNVIVDLVKDRQDLAEVRIVPMDLDKDSNVEFAEPPETVIPGASVLLLDGAVHSGRTMAACATAVLSRKPADLASYAVVVKRCSVFIPTLWGVMTDETDRTHFLLDKIPNSRLHAGVKRPQPHVHIRRLDKSHTSLPPFPCGVASIDRMTWDDRLWQMKTGDGAITTYVLEQGETIVGFLTVHIDERARPETMTIMEIASDKGNGFGGVLIRFADTLARQSECAVVRLHAIKDRVGFYERFGYSACMGSADLSLGLEVYRPMERPVLYHHQPESTL